MPNYEEMYKTLFRLQTMAINILQEAQKITEEMYISAEDWEEDLSLGDGKICPDPHPPRTENLSGFSFSEDE